MPNKYTSKKDSHVSKQKHKLENWSEYNCALRRRGIDVWLSKEAISQWYEGCCKRFDDLHLDEHQSSHQNEMITTCQIHSFHESDNILWVEGFAEPAA